MKRSTSAGIGSAEGVRVRSASDWGTVRPRLQTVPVYHTCPGRSPAHYPSSVFAIADEKARGGDPRAFRRGRRTSFRRRFFRGFGFADRLPHQPEREVLLALGLDRPRRALVLGDELGVRLLGLVHEHLDLLLALHLVGGSKLVMGLAFFEWGKGFGSHV